MFRYLFVLDVAFSLLGAAMVIGVGISALLLGWHLDVAPEQRPSYNNLLLLTVAFSVITSAAFASALGLHRKARWHWITHALFLFSCIASVPLFTRVLGNQ